MYLYSDVNIYGEKRNSGQNKRGAFRVQRPTGSHRRQRLQVLLDEDRLVLQTVGLTDIYLRLGRRKGSLEGEAIFP